MPVIFNDRWTRRLAVLVVAFCCAAADAQERQRSGRSRSGRRASRPPASKPAPETAPALPTQPADPALETIAEARLRLSRTPPDRRTRADHALLTGLDFLLALAKSDGTKAATFIDAIGYQSLPLSGELPEIAARPLPGEVLAPQLTARPAAEVGTLRLLPHVQVLRRDQVWECFPAVAAWMLPDQDLAVVVQPAEALARGWVAQPACLVVRLRAARATIVGGNLLAALDGWQPATVPPRAPAPAPAAPPPPSPDGEDK